MSITKLIKVGSVAGLTTIVDEYVPAVGETILVFEFCASAPQDPLVCAILSWDGNILWTIQADHSMPSSVWFQFTGDGVKKIKLELRNDSTVTYFFSGVVGIENTPPS